MEFRKNVLCIGAGYVGGPTMAVIAAKSPSIKVTVVDVNEEKIKAWQTDQLPIYEPGLLAIVQKSRGKNLFFSTEIEKSINEADIIFVSVNTPTKTFGEGAGKASDLQYIESTARSIIAASNSNKIVVEKSTLPVKTASALEKILNNNDKGLKFEVLSNPEFLAEGSAIRNLEFPDRVLIGSRETESGIKARQQLVDIYLNWVPREKIIESNVWSSELSKLTANAFLAQKISSINSISALCEKTGADISEISKAIGADNRIGNKFLNASIGFGGSCFKKDILNLVYICESLGLIEVATYWEGVIKINEYQENRFVKKMLSSMFNTLAGKKIALFGFAFKANTGDTRETPAYYVAKQLLVERANLSITDPKAISNAKIDLKDFVDNIKFTEDPYEAAKEADAIAVMTEWDLYKTLDYQKLFDSMRKPAFLFDGRNILDHNELTNIGFEVHAIGKSFD
ncbi:UDP-glucose 6-dehydrogenase [hydrothermal vent metagenome]|uniref:UDP-glucose 6-dehydrogenase n=1 Tax=hydrothermal vent metagenome TaxID=652676 RepID=A0A3B1BSF5_9ZZZZ